MSINFHVLFPLPHFNIPSKLLSVFIPFRPLSYFSFLSLPFFFPSALSSLILNIKKIIPQSLFLSISVSLPLTYPSCKP